MPVTIKSIAAEAGVSHQAVSAVLNGKNNCRVSPQRREQILAIARNRGYRTNFGYKLMRGQTTRTVAIVSATRQLESDNHIKQLILKLLQLLNLQGYSTYFSNSMTKEETENIRQIRELINRGAEHFIFIGSPIGHEAIQEELINSNRTYIGWNSFFDRDLHTNSQEASIVLFRFLTQKSGEFPTLIYPGSKSNSSNRILAFRKAAEEIMQEDGDRYIVEIPAVEWNESDFNHTAFNHGYQATAEIFARKKRPRAIAYYTDNYALGGAFWCQQNNIQVGKDIFLSGFNNIDAVRFNALPIASAAHPVNESIDILLNEMCNTGTFGRNLDLKIFLRPENNQPTT